jgi:BRCT domain type II-containing protein
VVVAAAQIEGPLLAELERLSRERKAIAEINRELGARAAALGLVKPSYARVRQLVHEARAAAESSTPRGDGSCSRSTCASGHRSRSSTSSTACPSARTA